MWFSVYFMLGFLELPKSRDVRFFIRLGKFQASISLNTFFTWFAPSHLGSRDACGADVVTMAVSEGRQHSLGLFSFFLSLWSIFIGLLPVP